MGVAELVAHLVTQRPRLVYGLVLLVAALSATVIGVALRFDSEILNLLPRHFNSVQALKIFNDEFAQSRELTFVLVDETGEADLDAFAEHFADLAREQPWATRVMSEMPIESPDGLEGLQRLALPLLLNLPPKKFDQALARLRPDAVSDRLRRLRDEIGAGSPRAEMELTFDPLGIMSLALEPLAGTSTLEETEPLTSPDGTLRIVPVITNQHNLGTQACREMMDTVRTFIAEVQNTWTEGPPPKIMVTGRTPYVAEMSRSMLVDVGSTLLTSLLIVVLIFAVGFRRLLPLLAIVLVLLLACLAAVAAGGIFLGQLNLITIGFCSILVGLGVDFGMLLFGCYQGCRDQGESHEQAVASSLKKLSGAVFFGAITTAAAFLCLLRSDTAGFAQLGVLIAIGICFAAAMMMTAFFTFIGDRHKPVRSDPLGTITERFVDFLLPRSLPILLVSALILAALTAAAFLPVGYLHFDVDPKSLEPEGSQAGNALKAIKSKLPAAEIEPILVIVNAPDAETASERWQALDKHWRQLVEKGVIRSFTTPSAFAVSAERQSANAAKLDPEKIAATGKALERALETNGFNRASFQPAFDTLDNLATVAHGDTSLFDWRQALPESSEWWFLMNRFFSDNPGIGAAYIMPKRAITSAEDKESLRTQLELPGTPVYMSGWTYTLADLVPWSKKKLVELSLLMLGINVVLLAFHIRRITYLAVLILSQFLATAALVTCLKLMETSLNLFNVLAFPLVLGVGVDYGIYVMLAVKQDGNTRRNLLTIVKPVFLSGLTTVGGFGSLALAHHPALRGLGVVCGLGIAWCLAVTLLFTLPAYLRLARK